MLLRHDFKSGQDLRLLAGHRLVRVTRKKARVPKGYRAVPVVGYDRIILEMAVWGERTASCLLQRSGSAVSRTGITLIHLAVAVATHRPLGGNSKYLIDCRLHVLASDSTNEVNVGLERQPFGVVIRILRRHVKESWEIVYVKPMSRAEFMKKFSAFHLSAP